MNQELKRIKKLYGEEMSRFCRGNFSTILEEEGALLKILTDNFEPSHFLYKDIVQGDLITEFKDYIIKLSNTQKEEIKNIVKTPEELLSEAGYDLYLCKTEEEIQTFKKYYAKGEKLCTFNGGRLNYCIVFFAVKKNVDEIKREDFLYPDRQDEYGTSVISIQFTKDSSHTISIKNRYNHRVVNPDATYSNNLDNIIEGLTSAFEQHYDVVQKHKNTDFEIPRYVRANDGKFYKFNYEINNTYFCTNNVVIRNYEVLRYEKEKYLIFDHYVLDKVNKCIGRQDAFSESLGKIEKLEEENKGDIKEVRIFNGGNEPIIITLNKENRIIGLKNNVVERIGNKFLNNNYSLSYLEMNNLKYVGDYFLYSNDLLKTLDFPQLLEFRGYFLYKNSTLESFKADKLEKVGEVFLNKGGKITYLSFPNLKEIDSYFLTHGRKLEFFEAPKLEKIGDYFLYHNTDLKKLELPSLKQIGDAFMHENEYLSQFIVPKLEKIGNSFFRSNLYLDYLDFPCLKELADDFLYTNKKVMNIYAPNLEKVGHYFLYNNDMLHSIRLPSLVEFGMDFLKNNKKLIFFDAPNLERVDSNAFALNTTLQVINAPKADLTYLGILKCHPNKRELLDNESKKSKRN